MRQYIVDAFTDRLFHGNQAAVCVVDEWPSSQMMQSIAKENRFSETAFVVREPQGWHLRWFTPGGEIDFCGHATLGAAFVLFSFYCRDAAEISFDTQVGKVSVRRRGDLFVMDFPAYECRPVAVTDSMAAAIGVRPVEAYLDRDLLLVLPSEGDVRELHPSLQLVKGLDGLLVAVTAEGKSGEGYDCVSRVFGPKLAVDEDPVTGSTHCMIAPYWCSRLGKSRLVCHQSSERGGDLYASAMGNRVQIAGKAVLFSTSELSV
jgi:predicted PhzF superfamily epimerase YddE/YHI9